MMETKRKAKPKPRPRSQKAIIDSLGARIKILAEQAARWQVEAQRVGGERNDVQRRLDDVLIVTEFKRVERMEADFEVCSKELEDLRVQLADKQAVLHIQQTMDLRLQVAALEGQLEGYRERVAEEDDNRREDARP